MYRLMQPSDRAAVVALWQKERGDTAEFINTAMDCRAARAITCLACAGRAT